MTSLQQSVGNAPLGHQTPYPTSYDNTLLFPVARAKQREAMGIALEWAFFGVDVWNAYELFWLNPRGKPVRSYATFTVDARSPYLAESKSVKLYLHSLNHQQFSTPEAVRQVIMRDLSSICGQAVHVTLLPTELTILSRTTPDDYVSLDELDVAITNYQRAPELLVCDTSTNVHEKLVSHLFKSHCLCTGQPDLGSIFVEYSGHQIDHQGLLAYLISYRDHVGFSENCIEQIFTDIYERMRPTKLAIFGRFTRRGGIDINPYRSTHAMPFETAHL